MTPLVPSKEWLLNINQEREKFSSLDKSNLNQVSQMLVSLLVTFKEMTPIIDKKSSIGLTIQHRHPCSLLYSSSRLLTSGKQQFVPQSEIHLNLAKHKICVSKSCGNLLHNLKYNNLNRGESGKIRAKKEDYLHNYWELLHNCQLRFNWSIRSYSDFRSETHQQSGKRTNPALKDRGGGKKNIRE
jgi:hypothetical protein